MGGGENGLGNGDENGVLITRTLKPPDSLDLARKTISERREGGGGGEGKKGKKLFGSGKLRRGGKHNESRKLPEGGTSSESQQNHAITSCAAEGRKEVDRNGETDRRKGETEKRQETERKGGGTGAMANGDDAKQDETEKLRRDRPRNKEKKKEKKKEIKKDGKKMTDEELVALASVDPQLYLVRTLFNLYVPLF